MQSSIVSRIVRPTAAGLTKPTSTGHVYQIRNHVKIYPSRRARTVSECYLDNTRTPYTDKYNMNEFNFKKRQLKPWQKVICKDKDNRFNRYHWNEAYTSDPKEAKETATSRLQRFQDSLRSRGEARERKSYQPPENVREQIVSIYKSLLDTDNEQTKSISDQDITNIDLNESRSLKFDLITKCMDAFGHEMPSSYLNDMVTVDDVVTYFSTEVRGINPFDCLISRKELPANLSILPEPDRFDKETDTRFNGFNAMPGIVSKVPGLRAGKKYRILNQDEFQWPDI